MTRPRALFIAPTAPAATGNGLAMRQGVFLEALARVADVELVVLPIAGASGDGEAFATALGVPSTTITIAGRMDTQFTLLSMIRDPAARLAAFRAYARGGRHAHLSFPVLAELRERFRGRRFDIVHAGRLYVSEAALAFDGLRTLDLDEDDAWAWRRQAELDRLAGNLDAARWHEQEAEAEARLLDRVAPAFASLFIASPLDRERIAADHPHLSPEIVPNGAGFGRSLVRRDDGRTLLFVGSLGYAPNSDGLAWFVERVLPLVLQHSAVRLRVVGRGRPPPGLHDNPNVEVVGEVADVSGAYDSATLAIAPLHAGGGTRIKLIEAAAHGVPIVSTSIGAQGLDLSGAMIWRADTHRDFADAILHALRDPAERQRRAAGARAHLSPTHDRDQILRALARRFEQAIAGATTRHNA